jgi:hypothetical protein
VALRDADGNPIPLEFLAYHERWGLGFVHSPAGIALVLVIVSLPTALLILFIHETSSDWLWGTGLLLCSIALLVGSRLAWLRQDRNFQRRMAAYEAWKLATRGQAKSRIQT